MRNRSMFLSGKNCKGVVKRDGAGEKDRARPAM